MDDQIAIHVEHVQKEFKVYMDKGMNLKERVLFKKRRRYEERKVLKDISFDVRRGEAIGLIGENGCGKSTTLKLLSRIMYPDAGKVEINGRVSALIELGAGFHPDLSGRENIYTNAAIFGLSRAEIDQRLQTIIDFSELGDFIDNPVRTYSSGMYMRLAFSVAINVDADILLIDEILAVGDVAFQAKCFNKLRDIKRKGTTIVIVSHSLGQIEQMCETSYWIDGGLIREQGNPMDVHQKYLRYMAEKNGTLSDHLLEKTTLAPVQESPQEETTQTPEQDPLDSFSAPIAEDKKKRWGSKDITFESITVLDHMGKETDQLESGKPFQIVMRYHINQPVDKVAFGIGIFRNDGMNCYGVNTDIDHLTIQPIGSDGQVVFQVEDNSLLEGEYLLDAAIHRPDGFPYDYYREVGRLTIHSVVKDIGVMRLKHEWRINDAGENIHSEIGY